MNLLLEILEEAVKTRKLEVLWPFQEDLIFMATLAQCFRHFWQILLFIFFYNQRRQITQDLIMQSFRFVFRNYLLPPLIKPFNIASQYMAFKEPQLSPAAVKLKIKSMTNAQIVNLRKKMTDINQAITSNNLAIGQKYVEKVKKAPFYYQILVQQFLKSQVSKKERINFSNSTKKQAISSIVKDFIVKGKLQEISPFQRKQSYQKFEKDYDKYAKRNLSQKIKLLPVLYLRSPLEIYLSENPQHTQSNYQQADKATYQQKFIKLQNEFDRKIIEISFQQNVGVSQLLTLARNQFKQKPKFAQILFI